MRQCVDLHLHTDQSDGVKTAADLLAIVRKKKLCAFSITDHDSINGYRAAKILLQENDPELITGLELSTSFEGNDLHLLAYLFDPENTDLNSTLEEFWKRRNNRGMEMVQKLNDMGIDISLEDVHQTAGQAAIGRPHVAEAIHRSGAVSSYEEAFQRYIGNGKPAYVPKMNFTPEEAIALIHQAGGVAILAHPVIDETYRHLELLVGMGLDGIEVFHPAHKQKHSDQLKHLAERFRLVTSGGSDYHGREGNYGNVGSQHVPKECLDSLRHRGQQRKGNL